MSLISQIIDGAKKIRDSASDTLNTIAKDAASIIGFVPKEEKEEAIREKEIAVRQFKSSEQRFKSSKEEVVSLKKDLAKARTRKQPLTRREEVEQEIELEEPEEPDRFKGITYRATIIYDMVDSISGFMIERNIVYNTITTSSLEELHNIISTKLNYQGISDVRYESKSIAFFKQNEDEAEEEFDGKYNVNR